MTLRDRLSKIAHTVVQREEEKRLQSLTPEIANKIGQYLTRQAEKGVWAASLYESDARKLDILNSFRVLVLPESRPLRDKLSKMLEGVTISLYPSETNGCSFLIFSWESSSLSEKQEDI